MNSQQLLILKLISVEAEIDFVIVSGDKITHLLSGAEISYNNLIDRRKTKYTPTILTDGVYRIHTGFKGRLLLMKYHMDRDYHKSLTIENCINVARRFSGNRF